MRPRSLLRNILSLELVVIWLIKGTMSSLSYSNNALSFYSNNGGFSPSLQISHLALVSLLLPWVNSEGTSSTSNQTESETTGRAYKTTSLAALRAGLGMPHKKTTASNALLANIDFLTQLTNSKQGKSTEMDPLKCFPKALCGLSAESAAITRRRKNSLITDYIRLMKAVSLNPNVMEDTMKKLKDEERAQQEEGNSSGSDEDDEDDEDDDDDDEDRRRRSQISQISQFQKRKSVTPVKIQKKKDTVSTKKPLRKKKKAPKNSDEFTKEYLKERANVGKLIGGGLQEENAQNWWAYEQENEDEESLEAMVDFSGTKLDSQSVEAYYTFGGKRKPRPPTGPEQPGGLPEPPAPKAPRGIPPMKAPPIPKPPVSPLHRYKQSQGGDGSTVSKFFKSLFGFGDKSDSSFTKDPFFAGFKRALPDGTPTVVTVDKTKEILTTAIEIGETLKSPNQCNSLFNGCAYQYVELLHVIDDIRESLANRGKQEFQTSQFFQGVEEYNEKDTGKTKASKKGSYGYKSSLSETSQAETLAPDYKESQSQLSKAKKKRRLQRKKKAYKSYRNGKMSSTSQESSIEIGSDEPTMYGSGQQTYDINQHKHGRGDRIHNYRIDDSYHHGQYHHQPGSASNYHQYDGSLHIRQPKSIWGTILSWFGFGGR